MGSKKGVWKDRPLIIGVDPGLTGSFSVVDMDKMKLVTTEDFPTYKKKSASRKQGYLSHVDVHALAMMIDAYAAHTALCVLEEPGAMPKQGLSSTFRFGHVCGQIHGILAANYLATVPVKPQVWKPALGLSSKQDSLDKVRMCFPGSRELFSLAKHHDRAESALLALYGVKYLSKLINAIRAS